MKIQTQKHGGADGMTGGYFFFAEDTFISHNKSQLLCRKADKPHLNDKINSNLLGLTVLVGHVPQLCFTASDAQGQHEINIHWVWQKLSTTHYIHLLDLLRNLIPKALNKRLH